MPRKIVGPTITESKTGAQAKAQRKARDKADKIIAPPMSNEKEVRRTRAASCLELETLPFAGTLGVVFHRIKGGFGTAMDYVPALAEHDTRFARLCHLWDKATRSDQRILPPEDFLSAAGITPVDFIREIAGVMFQMNADVGIMIAAINHPKVVERTVKAAMNIKGGARDRENLLKAAGTLPLPKSSHLHIHRDEVPSLGQAQISEAVGDEDSEVGRMPIFEADTVSAMEAIIGGGKIVDVSSKVVGDGKGNGKKEKGDNNGKRQG